MTAPLAVECKSCRALMLWVITAAGKNMPVDVSPVAGGKFVLALKKDGKLHAAVFDSRQHEPGRNRYTSHFQTCPNASQHSRGRW